MGADVVTCVSCGASNPPGTLTCARCNSSLDFGATVIGAPPDADATFIMDPAAPPPVAAPGASGGRIEAGDLIAERYEILQLLGEGGMGAVYKARDRELDRMVALKVIRREMASDAAILQRFKQELILAREITHRNVIRIFDLSTADGLQFITMEFIEGGDLAHLLRERRPGHDEGVRIMLQVARALEAAHEANVVHRDLKPQNIMLDKRGKVTVMDFGLARSVEAHGMTRTGTMMGTPAYMSPEQARGQAVDVRSDLFAFGIILCEVLTGVVPFQADSVLASLLKRTQEPAPAPRDLDPTVPETLSNIALKCMATAREDRYQSATELLADLEAYVAGVPGLAVTVLNRTVYMQPFVAVPKPKRLWKWIAAAALALLLLLGGGYYYFKALRPAAPVAPMTLMIADFNNHTGDAVFSGTLESTLKLALEGASFISAYDRTRVRDLGLPAVSGTLDEAKALTIAAGQGLNVVVSGALDRRGADYRISVRAVQTVTGKVVASAEETAPNKDQVLFAVTKLGTAVRKALGDSTSESAQRLAMETLTAASLEAVHEYSAGLDALSAGKFEETEKSISRALDLDPNFGMAYTVMASAARNMGRQQDAEKYVREAIKHIDRMTERERYRTRAYLYLLTGDYQKCVDEYGALLERYPSDSGAYTNVGVCQLHMRNVPKALEASRKAAAILPKRSIYHGNLAMNLAFNGDAQAAAKEAAEALKLGFANGYLHQAYASLLQEQPSQAAAAYRKFEEVNASDAATGLADLAVYEGRFSEAVQIYEKGVAADLAERRPDPDGAATKLWALANVQMLRGQKGAAVAAAKRALELSKASQTRVAAAQTLAAAGELTAARELARGLSSELQIEPQAYAKLIEGEIALKQGDGRGAVKLFTDANNLLDTWMGRFDLGRAYLEIGAFTQADSEFDRCIKRRGEALALFLDLPTYGYFPPVYYFQGRAREGMKSAGFSDSYRKFLNIRGKSGEDPLLAEVKRRLGQ